MMEIEIEEKEISSNENMKQTNEEEASPVVAAMTAAEQIHHHPHTNDYDDLTMSLISSNDMDLSLDHHDIKVNKQRRYWLPKEEERFFQIWGRDNWRLTKHGKNTIFFAQWSDELKEKYNIDVKLEEIQCKVNQTRAKFRQVKKQLENSKHTTVWKKYHIVEKILKNQYRSKDDEPIPPEALENNRDLSPTELLNTGSTSPPPSTSTMTTSSHEQNLSLTQIGGGTSSSVNHTSNNEEVNMSNVSLNDSSMTVGNYSNDMFNEDIDIKAEIEEDLRKEEEFINEYNQHSNSNYNSYQSVDGYGQQQPQTPELMQQQHQQYQQQYVNQLQDNHRPPPQPQPPLPSASTVASSTVVGAAVAVATAAPVSDQSQNYNNHLTVGADASTNHIIGGGVGGGVPGVVPGVGATSVGDPTNVLTNYNANTNMGMQPPRMINANTGASATTTPTTLIIGSSVGTRKRGNHRYHVSINNSNNLHQQNGIATGTDSLEAMYMEEVRRKNAILSEQSVISRKRLALEQRKINLMEEFFPKYLKLQEHILEKLESKTIAEAVAAAEVASSSAAATTTPEDSIDIQLNE